MLDTVRSDVMYGSALERRRPGQLRRKIATSATPAARIMVQVISWTSAPPTTNRLHVAFDAQASHSRTSAPAISLMASAVSPIPTPDAPSYAVSGAALRPIEPGA